LPSWDLYGSLEMPLFYLLSGFGLAIGYGRTQWEGAGLRQGHTP
jgi:hypothetical protein